MKKAIKVLGWVTLASVLLCAGGAAWFLHRVDQAGSPEAAIEDTAATVARRVDVSLADRSPGEYSTAGLDALTGQIETYDGTVLDSGGTYSVELNELQAWAAARFDVTTSNGLTGMPEDDAVVCLRFEVRWTYDRYTTYDTIDCP